MDTTSLSQAEHIAAAVAAFLMERSQSAEGTLIVGLDGPDCAGKTTMSQLIVGVLKDSCRILCVHQDDYLNAASLRSQNGDLDAEDFLQRYFDQEALVRSVIVPLRGVAERGKRFADIAILEGLFLYRTPLNEHFDVRVRIELSARKTLERALARDVGRLGDADWVRRHYVAQCLPAQSEYRRSSQPSAHADVLIEVEEDDRLSVRFARPA